MQPETLLAPELLGHEGETQDPSKRGTGLDDVSGLQSAGGADTQLCFHMHARFPSVPGMKTTQWLWLIPHEVLISWSSKAGE